jgi:divalent metal cation (Fe/Co/Zn/Cd) transporter
MIKGRNGGQHLFVDMTGAVDADITVEAGHAIAALSRERVLEGIPDVCEVLVHIDPRRTAVQRNSQPENIMDQETPCAL